MHRSPVDANKNPLKVQAFTTMCGLSKALKAVPAKIAQPVQQMLAKAASYEDLLTDLYSIKALDPNSSLSFAPAIAFLARQKSNELRNGATALAAKATHAAGNAAYVAGFIDQMTSIFQQAAASTDYCIGDNVGSTGNAGVAGLAGCLTAANDHTPIPSKEDGEAAELTAALTAVGGLNSLNMNSNSGKCLLTQTVTTHGAYGGGAGQPANIYWLNGIVHFTASALASSAFPKTATTIMQVPIIKTAVDAIDAAKMPECATDTTAQLLDKLSDTSKPQKFENFETTPKATGVGTETTKLTIDKADLEALAAALKAYRDDPSRKSKLAEARRERQIAVAKQLDEVPTQKQQSECKATSNKEANSKDTEVCNKKQKKSECRESDVCKWTSDKEEIGNHCKPKNDGEEQKNQGKGEGAAGTDAKKCSEKKKQEECKDGCKWEGTECKDSSILANKKFALSVVSAAFIGLISF
uniref:Variant surface glycoprotein 1125.4731 n=1 Tax=Trypanosoma brucei TaxID=5691 RepID=A0A1J0RAW9_9TRYP|nr:variant surface glycoprotein 1125.4731 [Trypanosoma brucei]